MDPTESSVLRALASLELPVSSIVRARGSAKHGQTDDDEYIAETTKQQQQQPSVSSQSSHNTLNGRRSLHEGGTGFSIVKATASVKSLKNSPDRIKRKGFQIVKATASVTYPKNNPAGEANRPKLSIVKATASVTYPKNNSAGEANRPKLSIVQATATKFGNHPQRNFLVGKNAHPKTMDPPAPAPETTISTSDLMEEKMN